MRLASIQWKGALRAGIVTEDGAGIRLFAAGVTMQDVIEGRAGEAAQETASLTEAVFAAPHPRPGKLLCLAGNYRDHIVESGFDAPAEGARLTPQVFLKPSTTLAGDGSAVELGPENVATGWEVELAVVIGRAGRDIAESSALDHVFGYTILNDLSERKLHGRMSPRETRANDPFFDWLNGKWFDGFAPCGPWIVTADEIPDPQALRLQLRVNGETRQDDSTAKMMFNVREQIAYCSKIMTLEPGDIIATGTPVGAGLGTGSKILAPGDAVECEIEKIGVLRHTMRARG